MLIASQCQGVEFHKRATTADEKSRLAREARFLGAVHHPGVVELLADECDTSNEEILRLRAVEARPLDSLTLDPPSAAGLGAATATILADLHDLGLAHGNCQGSHVLVARDGGPILCSFGNYLSSDDKDLAAAQREDIRGLAGALIGSFPIPVAGEGRRLRRRLERTRSGRPPSARVLARQLAESVPSCRLPAWQPDAAEAPTAPRGTPAVSADLDTSATSATPESAAADANPAPGRSGRHPAPGRSGRHPAPGRSGRQRGGRRRLTVYAAVFVAFAGVVLCAAALWAGGSHVARHRPSPMGCPAVDAGCKPIADEAGVITTNGSSWSVGQAGDIVVLGRWRCGSALPALLRPQTGQVWVFASWATSQIGTAGIPVTTAAGATSMAVIPGSGDCDGLAVVAQGRIEQVLAPGRLP